MIEYTYSIDRERGFKWKTYVARINGDDPNYILHREFLPVRFQRTWYGHSCSLNLQNGLYEVSVSKIDKESDECVQVNRWWVINADDKIYDYDFDDMNWQYALYADYLLQLNCG